MMNIKTLEKQTLAVGARTRAERITVAPYDKGRRRIRKWAGGAGRPQTPAQKFNEHTNTLQDWLLEKT